MKQKVVSLGLHFRMTGHSGEGGLGKGVDGCYGSCADWAPHNSRSTTVPFMVALVLGKGSRHLMAR